MLSALRHSIFVILPLLVSLDLGQVLPHVAALLARDARLKEIPFIAQTTTGADDPEGDERAKIREYHQELETALSTTGVAFVALVAEGESAADDKTPALDLWNTVVLSLVENTVKNETGLTAYAYTRRALRVLHRGNSSAMGARAEVKLGKPAYTLGPIAKGSTVYFINLLVRTTESLGPLA